MTIEAIRESGPFGWVKHRKELPPKTFYSFILPPGILKRVVDIISVNDIGICDIAINGGGLQIRYLNNEQINKANLIIPGENGKSIRLKWKNG